MFGLGMPEMIVILIIALMLFGPSKLPDLGKSLGEAIKGFKKGIQESESADDLKKVRQDAPKYEDHQ